MKRMHLVLVAIVMAVGFSAFTSADKATETVYYNLGSGWVPITNPCPEGDDHFCKITVGQQPNVQLYRNMDINQEVKYD